MASLRPNKRLATVQINDRTITASPGETILQAALRNGVDFPNSCRVGGCGTCKCRLTEGKVKELTETGYLLTAEELDRGYILACQSVARSDVRLEVDLSPMAERGVSGRVVERTKLTHDITRLVVALESPIAYRAGQYANLVLEGLPDTVRSYSFATPPSDDGRVEFFVRRVPGGAFSSHVDEHDVVGRSVRVDGPLGDFWLRPSDAPLLLVAGGSGLAPILALLKDALARGVSRPVTLLFGAREERDLYALDDLAAIAEEWQGAFRFVPVLSAVANDATWTGARGLVTEKIDDLLEEGAHAYLCGPPAMIDGAIERLKARGMDPANIHFDRFTTRADGPSSATTYGVATNTMTSTPSMFPATTSATREAAEDAGPERGPYAGIWHYAKYSLFHLLALLAVAVLFAGGPFITIGLLAVLTFYVLGDIYGGDDTSTPTYRYPGLLTLQLWLALPLLALIMFASTWSVCSGDPLGFGHWIMQWTGYDVVAARDATSFGHHVSVWIASGLLIGLVGTITAHELTHRTWDPVSMAIGRWLLAFSFDTVFAIEHVYGHHRYVSTTEDPATAPRGRNVYFHVVASTLKGNVSAWKIETARLRKKHLPIFSWRNAVIRGHLMSVFLVGAAFAMGGVRAAAFFTACALWGKALLEIVNYMEHYGMVRNPKLPVEPRHSWNTNRRVSSWTMFNLTRHSHHHAQGEVPYQDLKPYPDAPMMIAGYVTTIVVAMIPPLWHKLMTPKVLAWDRDYATDEERKLAALANAKSGVPALMRATAGARRRARPGRPQTARAS